MDANPDARLAVVWEGPALPRLEKLFAGTGTVFTGFLKQGDLPKAYAKHIDQNGASYTLKKASGS